MKAFYLVSLLLFSFFIFGCDDETTNPTFSMEEEINNARSFQAVSIFLSDTENELYHINAYQPPYIKLVDAYADNGFLIVTKLENNVQLKVYYNLSLVKSYKLNAQAYLDIYY